MQQAAASSNKNVTEFLLDAGLNAAEDVLGDQRLFRLDDDAWRASQEVLDRPVTDKPRLNEYAGGDGDGGGREADPILSLRGLGKAVWADEDPDAYVDRLREGWG